MLIIVLLLLVLIFLWVFYINNNKDIKQPPKELFKEKIDMDFSSLPQEDE